MDDQSALVNLDNLLLQLALETRELAQKKDDLTQQIQICKVDIQEKKKCIDETHKTIQKLDEDIQQKQNTVKCYKENVKSVRGTSDLLLQYEKTLEAELERRQESYNQDMKMFQERMENYWKIFQQHKEEYLQNPLATKLLKIQAENEEIERRIRAKEEEIIAKEKELKALQENHDLCDSVQKHGESNEQQAAPSESDTQCEVDMTSHQDPQPQGNKTDHEDVQIEMDEKASEKNQDQADGGDESNSSEVGVIGSTIWTNSEIRSEQSQGADQNGQEHTAEVDMNTNTSCGSDALEGMMEAEEQQESAEATVEEGSNEGAVCPPSSPVQMRALDTPTFCLISSPSTCQGHQEGGETPAFVFSMNSGPNTPTFSGFDCNFEVGPSQHEESPFTFSSSYFSKKSPETKLPGFLFDETESRTEEEFAFSFSSKSPQPKESGGTGDAFPFSFCLGKF
ncbi:probable serine/threonine-protein kinase kinX isoform X2 [Pangasianodon hypophthalmus]|uniref:probable serine/threonine-protein kinase kinX isoform X2 n=1 Tax=Pangasianodon hypophthalmus TaxID=310915 RepID=UPI0023077D4B|nr:probable serine/threonine-protein kinase kinX isoform X2 [Pangasianodon hypophthalmus]